MLGCLSDALIEYISAHGVYLIGILLSVIAESDLIDEGSVLIGKTGFDLFDLLRGQSRVAERNLFCRILAYGVFGSFGLFGLRVFSVTAMTRILCAVRVFIGNTVFAVRHSAFGSGIVPVVLPERYLRPCRIVRAFVLPFRQRGGNRYAHEQRTRQYAGNYHRSFLFHTHLSFMLIRGAFLFRLIAL